MLDVRMRHRFGRDGFALDVAFDAAPAGVTALFGPSGCGKSTVLGAVSGLLRPDEGRIALGDALWLDTGRGVLVKPERRRCAVVFQDARLFPHLSVGSNLRYGLKRAMRRKDGGGDAGPGFDEVVTLLGIAPLLQRRPGRLSGGERQRVALGRALLSRPRLLLMDEPLAALDQARRAEILPFLGRLRDVARIPILYVTHSLDEVDALAGHLVLMDAGRVLATGPVEELAARTDLPLLSARSDAGVLIPCLVRSATDGLAVLDFDGGSLTAVSRLVGPGARLRLRVKARDVAVAIAEPRGLSTRNILPVTLTAIDTGSGPGEVFLRLAAGPTTLLARVTRDSVGRLQLQPGMTVWALVKSVTLDH